MNIKEYNIDTEFNGIKLTFNTTGDLFSPQSLDKGTLAMLSFVEFNEYDKVLDLGCGYGTVGIYAAKIIGSDKVVMTDVSENAVNAAIENSTLNNLSNMNIYISDGFKDITETNFSLILSNPPYHTDFTVAKAFIEKGFNRLKLGGKMYMVTKRKDWYKNKLISIFGGVKIFEKDGYFIFMAEKKDSKYASSKKK